MRACTLGLGFGYRLMDLGCNGRRLSMAYTPRTHNCRAAVTSVAMNSVHSITPCIQSIVHSHPSPSPHGGHVTLVLHAYTRTRSRAGGEFETTIQVRDVQVCC